MAKSEALATIDEQFPVLANPAPVIEALRENLSGERLTPFDLTMARVPGGGSLSFQVDDPMDPGREDKTLRGIIISHRPVRGYWPQSIDEGGEKGPPQCWSDDATIGVGDPGGPCEACVLSKFGTRREKGVSQEEYAEIVAEMLDGSSPEEAAKAHPGKLARAQACSKNHQLFLLTEGEALPMIVKCPPTSLQPIKKFMLAAAARGMKADSMIVELSLKKRSGGSVPDHAQIQIKSLGPVSAGDVERIRAYAQAIEETLAPRSE